MVASEGVTPRQMEEDGATVIDPHAWQDLRNGHRYVDNLEARPRQRRPGTRR